MKTKLREEWLIKRRQISEKRRKEAAEKLLTAVLPYLSNHKLILSYASLRDEISTNQLNQELIARNSLVLPRVDQNNIWLYRVTNLNGQLSPRTFGIREPIPEQCKIVSPNEITHIIVPAIAFDTENHRLGYGKGYYDRFLHHHGSEITTIGIGFTEQLSEIPFPAERHDISLDHVVLV